MVPIDPAGPAVSNGTSFSFCTQEKVLEAGKIRVHGYILYSPGAMVVPVEEQKRRSGAMERDVWA